MSVQILLSVDVATYVAGGNTASFKTGGLSQVQVDVNVSSVRGVTPSLAFFIERRGADQNWYPVWSPTALTAAGLISNTIGNGLAVNNGLANEMRIRWTLTGAVITTTVVSGANSTTQNLTSTAGMLPGDTLQFVTAAVSRTIVTVTDSTHVVLNSAVNSTTSETVNVTNTPAVTFSGGVQGN